MRRCAIAVLLAAYTNQLAGCYGITTPDAHEFYQTEYISQFDKQNTIINQIKCELKQGIETVAAGFPRDEVGKGYSANWLDTWAAKVTLKLTVEEKGSLSPSFTYTNLPGIFTIGAGVSASAGATRTETVSIAWSVPFIRKFGGRIPCTHAGNILVESDLKIPDFIKRHATLAHIPGNIDRSKLDSPFDALNYEVSFVTSFGGNASPVWKFQRYTVDNGGTFAEASRTRTDDVTITLGPASKDDFGGFNLSADAEDLKQASLLAQAIRTGVR